jgi:hypothetical protein
VALNQLLAKPLGRYIRSRRVAELPLARSHESSEQIQDPENDEIKRVQVPPVRHVLVNSELGNGRIPWQRRSGRRARCA